MRDVDQQAVTVDAVAHRNALAVGVVGAGRGDSGYRLSSPEDLGGA
jgi:hypothetical protein